jgi:hypothetical protein
LLRSFGGDILSLDVGERSCSEIEGDSTPSQFKLLFKVSI